MYLFIDGFSRTWYIVVSMRVGKNCWNLEKSCKELSWPDKKPKIHFFGPNTKNNYFCGFSTF